MCDGWQASNTNGYFAVTGHWIEEQLPGQWKLEHSLLGFIRMNTAHNGQHLRQALFKICVCLGIIYKVYINKSHLALSLLIVFGRSVISHVIMHLTIVPCSMSLHGVTKVKQGSVLMIKSDISSKYIIANCDYNN